MGCGKVLRQGELEKCQKDLFDDLSKRSTNLFDSKLQKK